MIEESFEAELYWDLKELNPDAIIYPEYHQAYLGFAYKGEKYVAVYDNTEIENILAGDLVMSQSFVDECLKKLSGKVENDRVQEGVGRLAKIESIKLAADLLNDWDSPNHPLMLFYPKIVELEIEQNKNEIFKYEE